MSWSFFHLVPVAYEPCEEAVDAEERAARQRDDEASAPLVPKLSNVVAAYCNDHPGTSFGVILAAINRLYTIYDQLCEENTLDA